MQTIRAKIHKGIIEPLDPASLPLAEGKEVVVLIPEDRIEEGLTSERKALLGRIDAFRNRYGHLGCSVKDLVKEGRRNG
jgi:predicted DNA-binding antitoxin AbrB/MazE fold protein